MTDQRNDLPTHERYEDTHAPQNPPNSMVSQETRRAAVWSYFVPIVVLFLVFGVALVYWMGRDPIQNERGVLNERGEVIGTSGDRAFDPDSTAAEVESRGGTLAPLTSIGALLGQQIDTAARRSVTLTNVVVDSVDVEGSTVWVRDGADRIAVVGPGNEPTVQPGMTVTVGGTAEVDDSGNVRVRAETVEPVR